MLDIVIPFFNRKYLIQRAIQSVQNQSFHDWKLFLIDDGSCDQARDELKNKIKSKKIQYLFLDKNQGVSFARNYGIKQGCNPWVAFLDSDDEWLPKKLEKQMSYLKQNPETVLIHCNEIWMKHNKILNQKKKHKKHGGRIFKACTLLCCISPSATIIRRDVLENLGLFREDFPVCEDYDLWLKVTAQFDVVFLEEPLVIKHGGHKNQLSRAYPAMDYWRVKALFSHLQSTHLSLSEKKQVQKVILEKCNILLKGYKKYKNFESEKEIESYLKKATQMRFI